MLNTRVAKRYAKSLLEAAVGEGVLEDVRRDVDVFLAAFAASAPLRALLRNPVIRAERKEAVLRAIFAERTHPLFVAFLQLVCRKGRENLLDQIAKQFVALYNERNGIVEAEAITAIPLPEDLQRRVEQFIAAYFHGTPQVRYRHDPAIIGGIIIRRDDVQLDASLRGQLERLRQRLTSANGVDHSTRM